MNTYTTYGLCRGLTQPSYAGSAIPLDLGCVRTREGNSTVGAISMGTCGILGEDLQSNTQSSMLLVPGHKKDNDTSG